MTARITRTELKSLLDAGARLTVAEALPEKYYRHSHLPGAVNLPLDRLEEIAAERFPARDAAVVVYCADITCRNSDQAAERLAALGYTDVRVYAEGKKDWIEAGLPVETGLRAA
ncbi:MAG TPA: rhodanese-like domain-containing protein [Azospirillaceae bacterium]|nr:rhodanese-like domain-containing protein [Azospirillaceae bacterium]